MHIISLLRTPRSRRYFVLGSVACIIMLVGGVYLFSRIQKNVAAERATYSSYAEVAKTHEDTAFLPGAGDNPVRDKLNRIISDALTRKLSDAERLTLAREGMAAIDELEKQIDTIAETAVPVEEAIARMESTAHISYGFSTGGSAQTEIVTLARKELDIISDIRGLAYRANFDTRKVFDRIIADKGKLTDAHKRALNDQVPESEKQFDTRTNLYRELEDTRDQLHKKLTSVGTVLPTVKK